MNLKVVMLFCASTTTLVIAGNHGSSGAFSTQQRSQDISGAYSFSHDEKHADWESFRLEKGDKHGNKVGSYGLKEADGRIRQVDYVADAHGFRAKVNSNEPGVEGKNPAAAIFNAPQAIPAGNIATTSLLAPTGPALASFGRVALGHGLAQSAGAYGQVAIQSSSGYGGSASSLVQPVAAPAVGAYGSAPVATHVSEYQFTAFSPIRPAPISAPISLPVASSGQVASGYGGSLSTSFAPLPVAQTLAAPLSQQPILVNQAPLQQASGYGTSFAPTPLSYAAAPAYGAAPVANVVESPITGYSTGKTYAAPSQGLNFGSVKSRTVFRTLQLAAAPQPKVYAPQVFGQKKESW